MGAKPTPAEPAGKVVPLRRLDERKAALSDISDEALLAAGAGSATPPRSARCSIATTRRCIG